MSGFDGLGCQFSMFTPLVCVLVILALSVNKQGIYSAYNITDTSIRRTSATSLPVSRVLRQTAFLQVILQALRSNLHEREPEGSLVWRSGR